MREKEKKKKKKKRRKADKKNGQNQTWDNGQRSEYSLSNSSISSILSEDDAGEEGEFEKEAV